MKQQKSITAIILVAGNSTRYGKNRNKNFEKIHGKEVICYSLEAFCQNEYIDNIIIGIKREEMAIVKNILSNLKANKPVDIVLGGKTRQETVFHCLQKTESDLVMIHDGARPAIKQSYINQLIEEMKEYKGATVGVHTKDTIKITDENNLVIHTTLRHNTWIIQTPQCFDRKTLLTLHKKYQTEEMTDDCMLLEKNQEKVKIVESDYTNIKLTTYEDKEILTNFLINR